MAYWYSCQRFLACGSRDVGLSPVGALSLGRGTAGALLVGAGVRDRGEAGEQFGHLDAEDAGDGERAVD